MFNRGTFVSQELLESHPVLDLDLRCETRSRDNKMCDICGRGNPTRSFKFQLPYSLDTLDIMEEEPSTTKVLRLGESCELFQ